MWKSNDILETSKATINFVSETIVWKAGMYTPKDAIKFRTLIQSSNSGHPITASDFE